MFAIGTVSPAEIPRRNLHSANGCGNHRGCAETEINPSYPRVFHAQAVDEDIVEE